MYPGEISARIMDVHDELRRLIEHLDQFPEPADITVVEGSGRYVTLGFKRDLRRVVNTAAAATRQMMTELAEMDGAVRAALDDLTAQDEELAASAERLTSFLDQIDDTAPLGGGGVGGAEAGTTAITEGSPSSAAGETRGSESFSKGGSGE